MDRTVILYHSKYGSTRQYAEWLADSLNAPIYAAKDVTADTVCDASTVIIGGNLYAGTCTAEKIIAKLGDSLNGKRILIFTVGLADPAETEYFTPIADRIRAALPEAVRDGARIFHLRGHMKPDRLGFFDRLMLNVGKMIFSITQPDNENLDAMTRAADYVNRDALAPILAEINNEA